LDVLSIQSGGCRKGEKRLSVGRNARGGGERGGGGKGEEGGGGGGGGGGTIVDLLKSVFMGSIAEDRRTDQEPDSDSDSDSGRGRGRGRGRGAVSGAAAASALGGGNEEAETSSSRASRKSRDRSGNQNLDQNQSHQNRDYRRNRRIILLSSLSRIACRISRVTNRVEDNYYEATDSSSDRHQKKQKRTDSGHSSQISNITTNNEMFLHLRQDDSAVLNDADSSTERVSSILLELLCLVPMDYLTPGRNKVQDPVTGGADPNNLPTRISETTTNKLTEKYGIFGNAGDNEREWSSSEEGVSVVCLSDACDADYPTQHQIGKWVECGDLDGLWISVVSTPILHGFKKKGAQVLTADSLKESVSPRSIGTSERYYVGCGSDEYYPLILDSFFSLRIDVQIRSLFAISCRLKREVQRILRDRSVRPECSVSDMWDAVACCKRVSSIAKRVLENALSDADIPLSAYDSLFLAVSMLAGGECILNSQELVSSSGIFS
jgi:hypothetical protein